MNRLAPPYPLILTGLREGQIIPFLGSGASLVVGAQDEAWGTHFPTAGELAGRLAKMTEFPADEPHDLAKIAQYYDIVAGRFELYKTLHGIFSRDYPLASLHTFLADQATPLLIVTTNYDDLIERAFKAKGRAYEVVIHTTDPNLGDRLLCWPSDEAEPQEVNPNKL